MSESVKTFFDRLKRCEAFNDNSKIKGKKIVCIACAGYSSYGIDKLRGGRIFEIDENNTSKIITYMVHYKIII